MNTRNQNYTRNQYNLNASMRPEHLNSSRNMLDESMNFRGQQMDMNMQRGPIPSTFYQPQNIPHAEAQFQQDQFNRRSYDCNPNERRGGGSQLEHSSERLPELPREQYNHSTQRGAGNSRGGRYNDSMEFPPGRPYNRSPARDLGRMSPRSSLRRDIECVAPVQRNDNGGTMGQQPEKRASNADENLRRKRARRDHIDLPPLGQPGGRDDPNRRTLCGSRTKWYLRYLMAGFPPDEAISMAREPRQPAAKYKSHPSYIDRRRPSRDRQNEDGRPGTSRTSDRDDGPLKVCLKPLGYPEIKLTHNEKLDLEEAIIIEVATSSLEVPLSFTSIAFKRGYVEVDCLNKFSADWLMRTGSQLASYQGRPVETKLNVDLNEEYIINLYLPRSVGKSNEFLLQLLKSQNAHNIDMWRLVSRKDQGSGVAVVFSIDRKSAYDIAEKGHTLYYRIGTIPVRGLMHLDNNQEEEPSAPAPLIIDVDNLPDYPSFNGKEDGNFEPHH